MIQGRSECDRLEIASRQPRVSRLGAKRPPPCVEAVLGGLQRHHRWSGAPRRDSRLSPVSYGGEELLVLASDWMIDSGVLLGLHQNLFVIPQLAHPGGTG
jgi:hypothetical protein